jgi:ABC-type Zn uptake system ZnuABC Zn-binding protein ZnuA
MSSHSGGTTAPEPGPLGPLVVEATAGSSLLPVDLPGHGARHEHGGKTPPRPKELDPNTWLDPTLAQAQVEAIRAALARADPAGAAEYAARARAYTERLAALHGPASGSTRS